MSIFLSVDQVGNLLGISKQAVRRNCASDKYTTRQVPAKGGKGGLKYEIALDSLPEYAQKSYHEALFNQQVEKIYDDKNEGNASARAGQHYGENGRGGVLPATDKPDNSSSNGSDGVAKVRGNRVLEAHRGLLRIAPNLSKNEATNGVNQGGVSVCGRRGSIDAERQGHDVSQVSDVSAERRDTAHFDSNEGQRKVDRAIQVIFRFIETFNGTEKAAVEHINQEYATGGLPSNLVYALDNCKEKKRKNGPVLSPRTLLNWKHRKASTGTYMPKKRQKDLSVKEWHAAAIALYAMPQKTTYTAVVAELQKMFGKEITYDIVYDFFTEKYSQSDLLKGRHAGQQLRALQYYKKRTAAGMMPWDEVHADGWNTHFTAPHPITGEYVTYELWDFHDVATRFIPPFSIGLTENTEVIAKGIEEAIRFGGVMRILMTDSTKIVKNNVKFTGNPVLSIADMAGITITHPVKVGSGQTNGIAENFHSWIDKECRVLATYQAKNMDSLTLRRTQKLTAKLVKAKTANDVEAIAETSKELAKTSKGIVFQTYQEAIDWLETIRQKWNKKPHSNLKKVRDGITGRMRHQSPQEALDEWKANGWEPVAMDEADLIDLFRPRTKLFVRRGTVKPYGGKDGPRFRHKELDHWEGKEVIVAYDIMHYRQVWVMDLQGALICEAPFDEACSYRSQTAMESAEEKRAAAQIRRLEKKIGTVEKRAGLDKVDAIESTATRVLDYSIDAPVVSQKISMDELYAKAAEQEQEEEKPKLTAQETWLKYFSPSEEEGEKPKKRVISYE